MALGDTMRMADCRRVTMYCNENRYTTSAALLCAAQRGSRPRVLCRGSPPPRRSSPSRHTLRRWARPSATQSTGPYAGPHARPPTLFAAQQERFRRAPRVAAHTRLQRAHRLRGVARGHHARAAAVGCGHIPTRLALEAAAQLWHCTVIPNPTAFCVGNDERHGSAGPFIAYNASRVPRQRRNVFDTLPTALLYRCYAAGVALSCRTRSARARARRSVCSGGAGRRTTHSVARRIGAVRSASAHRPP